MQVFLDEVEARHPLDKIAMVLDGAGWHSSHSPKPPANVYLLSQSPYAPELNTVKHVWDELREKYFHNLAFDSMEALEDRLETSLQNP